MKSKHIDTIAMVRKIRDKDAALYWKNKQEYFKIVKEAGKKLAAMRAVRKVHGA
ncbi:MAG: hypothetical protein HY961_15745 [Ignavibacteriae bacterium]|nr:hypothetical protein [Ignavibacteriota bacterium]